jgi:Cu/Ag efflux protein CusF
MSRKSRDAELLEDNRISKNYFIGFTFLLIPHPLSLIPFNEVLILIREKKLFIVLIFGLLICAACRKPTTVYQGVGLVEEVQKETLMIQINHEEIKGLMPAMSMPYRVKDKAMLERVKSGDKVDFTVEDGSSGIFLIEIKKAEANPNSNSPAPPANANQSSKTPN